MSEEFWIYFYRKRVSLVSCLLSSLFWLTLSLHLFSVPLEGSGELSLFAVLVKVTCSLPRGPQGPGSSRQGERAEHLSGTADMKEKVIS